MPLLTQQAKDLLGNIALLILIAAFVVAMSRWLNSTNASKEDSDVNWPDAM